MLCTYVFTCFVLDNVLGPLFAMTSHVTICAVLELTRATTDRQYVPECADFKKQLRRVGSMSPKHRACIACLTAAHAGNTSPLNYLPRHFRCRPLDRQRRLTWSSRSDYVTDLILLAVLLAVLSHGNKLHRRHKFLLGSSPSHCRGHNCHTPDSKTPLGDADILRGAQPLQHRTDPVACPPAPSNPGLSQQPLGG